jgi:hypothetical protein
MSRLFCSRKVFGPAVAVGSLLLVFFLFAVPADAQLSFRIGAAGTAAGMNNWPAAESPNFAINGAGQKYLNFGEFRTGVAVAPAAGGGAPTSIQVWTANDAPERDPINFRLYGTNAAASGAAGSNIAGLNLIASGDLALPAGRNAGGTAALMAANSATATFANTTSYPTYVVVFPSVKNPATSNSMQIADVQLFNAAGTGLFAASNTIVGGQLIPEPSTLLLVTMGLMVAAAGRRRTA